MEISPNVELIDGQYIDMLIEQVFDTIMREAYDEPGLDEAYTMVVRKYISPDCPNLVASHAGKDKVNAGAVHYLAMLQLDYSVVHNISPAWPLGGFDALPDAVTAITISYGDGETFTDLAPGTSINQASLAAIIQLAREVAFDHYNQPELPLDATKGKGYAH